ncbi:MAG: 50S ribosomal protein L13 [Firmicutes bacterium]|mgnify:CR=1 FL=1|nr:50S ribosomal protein L13 [Bacillota bacterium]HQD40158.1 50S ribosomal protein L13 [Bacillota bacterium]
MKTTYMAKPNEVERTWYVVDAKDQVLGRMAARVAMILSGKHKPTYTPGVDTGDYVIIINADKVRVTGKKRENKLYYRHSLYPGGLKVETFSQLLARKPERVIELAVKRMLPKNRLGRKMFKKMKVYSGSEHPHQAQKPQPLSLD